MEGIDWRLDRALVNIGKVTLLLLMAVLFGWLVFGWLVSLLLWLSGSYAGSVAVGVSWVAVVLFVTGLKIP